VEIAGRLLDAGAEVVAHDPVVSSVPSLPGLRMAASALDAVRDADAVLIATEWPEYLELDLDKVAELMRGDFLLDGRNVLDPNAVVAAGLTFEGMGRPLVSPAFG
jgi:UDPglucose 6-dehydrogenase